MPLTFAPYMKEVTVKKIAAADAVKRRLQELGVAVGGTIMLISGGKGGVIVQVLSGRLCLDNDLAAKILVA